MQIQHITDPQTPHVPCTSEH